MFLVSLNQFQYCDTEGYLGEGILQYPECVALQNGVHVKSLKEIKTLNTSQKINIY